MAKDEDKVRIRITSPVKAKEASAKDGVAIIGEEFEVSKDRAEDFYKAGAAVDVSDPQQAKSPDSSKADKTINAEGEGEKPEEKKAAAKKPASRSAKSAKDSETKASKSNTTTKDESKNSHETNNTTAPAKK